MSLSLTNYKKFSKKTFPFVEKSLVITGDSATGKTQLLWAHLFFFLAHNFCCKSNQKVLSLRNEMAVWINPAFKRLNHWNTFVTRISKDKMNGTAQIQGRISLYDPEVSFKLKTNGSLIIENENQITKNIGFAHMGVCYQFSMEREITNTLSSFDQSLREKYTNLNKEYKQKMKNSLQMLFPSLVDIIEEPYNGIFTLEHRSDSEEDMNVINDGVEEDDSDDEEEIEGYKIEIMAQSAAFQKIFASLVLFLTLVTLRTSNKYYLIDEPDALLDHNTAEKFVTRLKSLSEFYSVKLIVTTSNSNIANLFEEKIYL